MCQKDAQCSPRWGWASREPSGTAQRSYLHTRVQNRLCFKVLPAWYLVHLQEVTSESGFHTSHVDWMFLSQGRCLHYLATQTAHSCSGSVGCLCFCKDWWLCSISWSQMEDEVVRSRWGALPATFLYLQIDTQSAQRNSSITSKAGGFLPLFPQSTPKVYVPFRDSFLLESQPSFHFVPQDFLPWVPHTPFLWKRAPKQVWTWRGTVKKTPESEPQPESILRAVIRRAAKWVTVHTLFLISASFYEGWEGQVLSFFTFHKWRHIHTFMRSVSQPVNVYQASVYSWYNAGHCESSKTCVPFLLSVAHSWATFFIVSWKANVCSNKWRWVLGVLC